MTGRLREAIPLAGGEWLVSFTTRANPAEVLDQARGREMEITIKRRSKPRTLDANAFCWALCTDIGRALDPPLDKEEVYRQAIRAVGVYTQVSVVIWDLDKIRQRWESRGTGWFMDIVDDAGTGRKLIHLYFGSSTYSQDEMQNLLNWLVDQAEQMGLPIPISKEEERRLIERWKGKA